MSTNTSRPGLLRFPKRNKTPLPEPDDPWVSGRSRWGFQSFRRGKDKKWHFSGQEKDETVRKVVRKHWLFLVKPALPVIGSIAFLLIVLAIAARTPPALHPLWTLLEVVATFLILGTAIWFLYKDFILWWLETYIVTNKRIISSRGLLQPTRQETPLEKVTQVGVDIKPLGFILSYGTVHVYLTGGDFYVKDVPNPKEVKDAIQGISDEIKAKKPPKEKLPEPADPAIKSVLEGLAKGKPVPTLPDADAHYPPPADGIRRPRRTFGGILRIPCEVHYTSDEYTVMYIQRSRFVLYRNLALPLLLFLLLLPVAFYGLSLLFMISLIEFSLLILMAVIYINYVDDVFILSNKRIIDIERRLIFFYEARTETEYKQIRDTRVEVANVLERFLDIGNVYIETPGTTPDIIFSRVDHPFVIQDKLQEIKSFKEKAEAVKKENDSKEEFNTWFSKIVTTLEQNLDHKMQSEGAPNLQNLDFWSAADRAAEFGLRVVVIGEASVNSNQPPGRVIQQSPPSGTLINRGGEIQVLLSKRPTTIILR